MHIYMHAWMHEWAWTIIQANVTRCMAISLIWFARMVVYKGVVVLREWWCINGWSFTRMVVFYEEYRVLFYEKCRMYNTYLKMVFLLFSRFTSKQVSYVVHVKRRSSILKPSWWYLENRQKCNVLNSYQ